MPQGGANVEVALSGRRPEAFEEVQRVRPVLRDAVFVPCDIDDASSLTAALEVGALPTDLLQMEFIPSIRQSPRKSVTYWQAVDLGSIDSFARLACQPDCMSLPTSRWH